MRCATPWLRASPLEAWGLKGQFWTPVGVNFERRLTVVRLQPDPERVRGWLERILNQVCASSIDPSRREDVAAAVLVFCGTDKGRAVQARRRLLRLGWDLDGSPPNGSGAEGFARAVQPMIGAAELWDEVVRRRTPGEEVKALRDLAQAGDREALNASAFPNLVSQESEWKIIEGAFGTARWDRTVRFVSKPICPKCYSALPSSEVWKMRAYGLATALNCCGRVLLLESD